MTAISPHQIEISARETLGLVVQKLELLPASGSGRRYFRLTTERGNMLAAINADIKENQAFIQFSRYFKSQGIPVPEIYGVDPKGEIYFLEDLGHQTLFDLLGEERDSSWPDPHVRRLYELSVDQLFEMQVKAGPGLDYSWCYPRKSFDRQSMMWDLNYFKYYFLKLAYIPFDEQKLEDDFQRFCGILEQAPADYFMFRDFQSRNIVIREHQPYFIDYQGGRKGPLQYDLASLLFDAKADLPDSFRESLLNRYLAHVEGAKLSNGKQWLSLFWPFVLIRIMQAMGAYGYRGYYEKKQHFLKSVPFAAHNLSNALLKFDRAAEFPELSNVWNLIIDRFATPKEEANEASLKLQINILSFSYKKGLPQDASEHGGGFIFDCRSLPNPGRQEQYRELTGLDKAVADFLAASDEVNAFLNHSSALVHQAILNYLHRDFNHLSVAFGCTGGQHRSVYCAENLAHKLSTQFGDKISIAIVHREQ